MRKKKKWRRGCVSRRKAIDIYRLTISTIFIFILAVQLVALYSIILIKLKKQAHPSEQSANAEEQRTRRNRNVLKMAIAIVLAFFFFAGPPTSLTSWYLFVCPGIFHIPVVQIYTVISAPFLSLHMLTTLRSGFFGSDGFGYFQWKTETSYFWCQLGHKRKCSLKWKLSNSKWWTLQWLYNVLFGTKNSYLCARSSSLMRILRQYWIQNI